MRNPALAVSASIVFASAALACSYATFVWEPISDADPPYYSVLAGGEQWWIDQSGKRIQFEPPAPVTDTDRLIPARDADLIGYSRQGKAAIPPRYLDADEFHEERARVVLKGPCVPVDAGLCGAPVVLPRTAVPRSVPMLDVLSGRWRPSAPACRYTFIDTLGAVAGSADFDEATQFSQGLAAVRVGKVWGYVDKSLSLLIAPRFQAAGSFSEGLAAVRGSEGYSYIDRTGTVVIPGPFESVADFHEGLAAVRQKESSWYIDRAGKQAFPGVYAHAGRFFHGRANVLIQDGTLAYIDRAGRVVYRWKSR